MAAFRFLGEAAGFVSSPLTARLVAAARPQPLGISAQCHHSTSTLRKSVSFWSIATSGERIPGAHLKPILYKIKGSCRRHRHPCRRSGFSPLAVAVATPVISGDRSNAVDSIAIFGDTAGGRSSIATSNERSFCLMAEDAGARFCTKSMTTTNEPLFFIGCPSPAKAQHFDRCMVSINALRKRQSDFIVNDWILDSGAFTELSRFGAYRHSVEDYAREVLRWSRCGNLLAAVSQDYMCESFILEKTGLSVREHQRLTIERYDALLSLIQETSLPVLPVLQGFRVSDYLNHIDAYGARLGPGAWVGVGSVCKRNARPGEIADILAAIKNKRPDFRLHGFGLKLTALENREVRELLYSSDSMAWSFPSRFGKGDDSLDTADEYLERVREVLADCVQKRAPVTAGPGNNQGRKSNWKNSPTVAIRIPAAFAPELLEVAKRWDLSRSAVSHRNGAEPGHIVINGDAGEVLAVAGSGSSAGVLDINGDASSSGVGKREAFESYDGGKGNVFRHIINEMPPHRVFVEGCLGFGYVMRAKRPAEISYGVEIDSKALEAWRGVSIPGLTLYQADVIALLESFEWAGDELVYLDPPYPLKTRSYQGKVYRHEMTDDDHRRLLKVIKRIPARVIISSYWSKLYANALSDWRTVSFPTVKRNGEKATEWLWINYPQPLELHDYSYVGDGFRERERIRRRLKRWVKNFRGMDAMEAQAIAAALKQVSDERSTLASGGDAAGVSRVITG